MLNCFLFAWSAFHGLEKMQIFRLFSFQWSYGILLWELFSYDGHPYKGLENQEIGKFVKKGNRLEKPDGTPGEV